MRVPLSWLREYVEFDLPVERLAERLTVLGMEVGSIETIGADWQNVVVGELLEVIPHPNADRLNLTKVRVSNSDAPLSIVCGAHNIVAGQRVPVALPGAVLPGDRKIGVTKIQGTESQGMLCSGAELGLTTDADGILILDPGETLGKALADVVGDVVIDVDVKPNRGDALSLIGLAREVAAITGGKLRWPAINVPESGDATADHLSVQVDDEGLCPRFVGRWVDGLKIGPSPLKVQLRLGAAGMRPVSNVVDASNYVMLEMGKPIHVFDATAVSGGKIVVRTARAGEKIETLDHVERALTPDTLVIADERAAIGIAGVMGGAGSEVSEATTSAIVESAVFDPVSVRRTAFRYGLRSEASLRFEKGQESRLARLGADRTAQLLAEWAGARVATGVVDTHPADEEPRRVSFRPARVSRLLGGEISAKDMKEALGRVEIATEAGAGADSLTAVVPTHRRDIEIEEDVAEEVIRVIGYETLAPRLPDTPMPAYRDEPTLVTNRLRDALAGRGLVEVLTNGLIAPLDHARLGLAADDPATIRIANPVTADHSELRRSLIPGLVAVLARNGRQRRTDVAIFELGATHEWCDGGPVQTELLGLLMAGDWRAPSWAEPARTASLDDLKGVLEALVARFGHGRLEYGPATALADVEHPGRTAVVDLVSGDERTILGRVGELHPAYLAAYEVRAEHVAFAMFDLTALRTLAAEIPKVRTLDTLPAVERDLAVVVKRDTAAADVENAMRSAAGPHPASITLFDRYTGAPLADDEVSLAYRLRFQPATEGLSEAQLDEAVNKVRNALETEVGGRIRAG
ncbi:MAG: phenylalanyl-tRNA synthetase beta chain [Chloroflexota bacterium]|jgi:phenylalanyl-tRNA synthetase beta chain|nr:phenylalanyl-tRNA synthetase beta chain [Chloroflexota bacterium]